VSERVSSFLTAHEHWRFWVVLCEYSKFRIESNSYFTIRFDSKPMKRSQRL